MLNIHFKIHGNSHDKDIIYNYDEVYPSNENTNEENIILKRLHTKKDELELFCSCTKEKIPLTVNYNWKKIINNNGMEMKTRSFYLQNAKGTSHLHKDNCEFKGKKAESYRPWLEANGYILASIKFPRNISKEKSNNSSESFGSNPYIQSEKKLNGFMRQLISDAWDYKTNIEKRSISFEEFYDFMIFRTNKIKINENATLKSFLCNKQYIKDNAICDANKHNRSNYYRQKEIQENKNLPNYMFIISKYISMEDYSENNYIVYLENTHTQEPFKYICDKRKWNEAIKSNLVKEPPFIVGGFTQYDSKDKTIRIYDLSIVPISNNGVWVESLYERKLYNLLHENKRIFKKPYVSYSVFENMKVDGILLDTSHKRGTIIEVFGESESNEEYHKRRIYKVNLFSKLKDFGFWKWDAYIGEDIPQLPR